MINSFAHPGERTLRTPATPDDPPVFSSYPFPRLADGRRRPPRLGVGSPGGHGLLGWHEWQLGSFRELVDRFGREHSESQRRPRLRG